MPVTNFTSGAWSKRKARFLRRIARQKLPLLALACCAAVFTADAWKIFPCILWLLTLLLLFATSRRYALITAVLSLSCAALHQYRLHDTRQREALIGGGILTNFRAKILEEPKCGERTWRCLALVLESSLTPHSQQKILLSGTGTPPQLGQEITAQGRWEKIPEPRNHGEFNRAAHMHRLGVTAECFAIRHQDAGKPIPAFWQITRSAREKFRYAITQGLIENSDEAKVILAMVIGEQPPYHDAILEPFRLSGTLHLFSVSGQHVNLVAAILWFALFLLRVPRRFAILLLIPTVFGYAWLTGASPPAVRAAWMAAVFLSAFLFQRKANLMHALSAVIIVAMILDSNLLFLAGVQLSYGIVAVISIGLSLTHNLLEKFSWHDSYLPRDLYTPAQTRIGDIWKKSWQSIIISTSACIGSAPLTIRYFSIITPISIITNLILTPLVAGILALAMLSAACAPLSPWLSRHCNHLNAALARHSIHTTRFFSAIPGGHTRIAPARPARDAVHIFDLPRGGSAILVQSRTQDVLFDCGSQHSFRSIVFPALNHFGSQPRTLILSHPEAAHIGGSISALQQFSFQQIIAPVHTARSASFRSLQKHASSSNTPFLCAQNGARWPQSKSITWEILLAPDPQEKDDIADQRVAIYLLHFHGFRILIAQDAGATAWSRLHQTHPTLRCDVIICGRHSRHMPELAEILAHTGARAIIASHADFPASERIPDRWISYANSNNIALFHQGLTGMVTLGIQENKDLAIRTFINPESPSPPLPTLLQLAK